MHRLKLDSLSCMSCGICMDVCQSNAIAMREFTACSIEGGMYSYLQLRRFDAEERVPVTVGTFPHLARPEQCDGCQQCVRQCPVRALELKQSGLRDTELFAHEAKESLSKTQNHPQLHHFIPP